MFDDPRERASNDIDPVTGNFIIEKSPDNKELEQSRKVLSFHAYDPGWMQVPSNEALYNEIRIEYEDSSDEERLLADTADAVVEAIGLFSSLASYAGDDFYSLRHIGEDPASVTANWEKGSTDDPSLVAEGYHRHGNNNLIYQEFRDIMRGLDTAIRLKNQGKPIIEFASENTEFSNSEIIEVRQFATAFVAIVSREAWQAKVEEPAGTTITGFYRRDKSMIYVEEGAPEDELLDTCKHEYSHMFDNAVKVALNQARSVRQIRNQEELTLEDETIFSAKTEISAYLEDPAAIEYDLKSVIRLIKIHIEKGGYERLLDNEIDRQKTEAIFTGAQTAIPFLRSLIKEAGLNPQDKRTEIAFMKMFLSLLPNNSQALKSLGKIPESGLYSQGR